MIDLSKLNQQQKEAVTTIDGQVIAVAGAGSGKTTALTYRIAYMIDKKIKPYNILVITFTNKAAAEIKSRVIDLIGEEAKDVWIGTFHSICLRILRTHASKLGYGTFTIYDDKDSDKILKSIISALEKENPLLDLDMDIVKKYISEQKSNMVYPNQAEINAENDEQLKTHAQIYQIYQAQLKFNNAMDFDDLILNVYTLLTTDDDIREKYQNKFKYVLNDESQDNNKLGYKLLDLFSGKYENLFIIGDDWQSIYGFRRANLASFLKFTTKYPEAKTVKIETNYRSTQHIVDGANAVISNNKQRLDKTCTSNNEVGRKIHYYFLEDEYTEAYNTVNIIKDALKRGCPASEITVLYRTNFQSRVIEQELVKNKIPYNVVSGIGFFDRKEIKDIVAYIKLIVNPYDAAAFARIINVPKRGVGEASIDKINKAAFDNDISILEQLRRVDEIKGIPKKAKPQIESFVETIESLREYMVTESGISRVSHNIVDIFERTGYQNMLVCEDGGEDRIANIEELISMAVRAEEEGINMEEFILNIALLSDQDAISDNKINLTTVHSSKGLEFDVVILVGMCEGIFPHFRSQSESELEEERRLLYVAMTRARREFNLSSMRYKMVKGQVQSQNVSRFIQEIPEENMQVIISNSPNKNVRTW